MIESLVSYILNVLISHPLFTVVGLFAVFLISKLVFSSKGNNPFTKDHRRPKEPFVHDTKARDAVLKQRFKPNKVPTALDALVIGSGIGGLASAALLTRAGKKVLVLEQHDQAGGCCHSFVEKGFEFDSGIHYVGGLYDNSVMRVLLDELTCNQLGWTKMDDVYDTVALGPSSSPRLFPMTAGKEAFINELITRFPEEESAIKRYVHLVTDAAGTFAGLAILKLVPWWLARVLVTTGAYRLLFKCYRHCYANSTLQEILEGLTDNAELRIVLSYICGDYGMSPDQAPFLMHAVVVNHYFDGAWYPSGGTSEIAFHLVQTIQSNGGNALCQAPVSAILCDAKGHAVGVKVGETEIEAQIIVSDAGVSNTFNRLLPLEVAKTSYIYPLIKKVGPSVSFITTFVGCEGSPKELNLPSGNVWYFNATDLNKCFRDFFSAKQEDIDDLDMPINFISFPSSKDSEWNAKCPGKSALLMITLANWEWFSEWDGEKVRHRGERYESIKDVIGRKMWQQAVDLYPQLDGKKVYMEVGTPVTNSHYLDTQRGEMYGLDHSVARFQADAASKLRPQTDIPGLYLTGQDIMSCGFSSALFASIFTASQILGRNVYSDLLAFRKTILANDKNMTEKKYE